MESVTWYGWSNESNLSPKRRKETGALNVWVGRGINNLGIHSKACVPVNLSTPGSETFLYLMPIIYSVTDFTCQ